MTADEFRHPECSRAGAPALEIGRLYKQHQRMVSALCRVLLRDPVEAEDAVQQTFLSAFGSLIGGTAPRQPGPWLATIARRECWARTAQQQRRPLGLGDADMEAGSDNPVEEAVRRADVASLWRAINDLPRNQRRALLLREFSGLSYAEVAVALGVTESAVDALLVRARRQLRDAYGTFAGAANVALTPLVLLHHRLLRLLGGSNASVRTGAGAWVAAGLPMAVKLAATTTAVAIAAVGAGLTPIAFHHGRPRTSPSQIGPVAEIALARRTGEHDSSASPVWLSFGGTGHRVLTPADAGRFARDDAVSLVTTGSGSVPGSTTDAAPAHAPTTADGPSPTPPTTARDSTSTDTTPSELTSTEATPSDAPPTGATPTDATPTDTTPTDTTPTDTASTDTTPTDTTPTDTASTDTTTATTTPSDGPSPP